MAAILLQPPSFTCGWSVAPFYSISVDSSDFNHATWQAMVKLIKALLGQSVLEASSNGLPAECVALTGQHRPRHRGR
jgi:hypothetical protein